MKSFSELSPNETKKILGCMNEYAEYNEKWHLLIAYYALSEYDGETETPNLPKLELNHEVTNWNLKGNRSINDPLLLLWMTEAAGIELTNEIKKCIDEMQGMPCGHATKENDKNLVDMFTCELWKEIASKILEK